MLSRYPGSLNAKSLSESGDCREDYFEWFFNPALSPYRSLIDAVYRTMQYRGDDTVLLAGEVSPESCLLFRFTMKSQDRKGRNHRRCEVMKVKNSELSALLNGEFEAVPDERTEEFRVESVERAALPQCDRRSVQGRAFDVYARNPNAYWFKSEAPVSHSHSEQRARGDSRSPVRPVKKVGRQKNGGRIMYKVFGVFLIVLCALGGWSHFKSTAEMERLRRRLANCNEEIEGLKKERAELQGKIEKYDRWIEARSSFELNKAKLKVKFEEISKKFEEAENLWQRIDETPKPASTQALLQDEKGTAPSITPKKSSNGNAPKQKQPRRDDEEEKSSRDIPDKMKNPYFRVSRVPIRQNSLVGDGFTLCAKHPIG